ncbi:flagellar basal-body rod protein FlgG [Fluviicoccus keumensis]|uniref:Flagellar basal-body rod protein FlgG n=1 Tax=Fluviicoccus keumensis TaxID=1435465 RepID=A0A4Q7YP75_9GAMM|nr:flagellar basal-body rod protein FlgG [Fluviicoccus keumensis]RZU38509.1 flagellar basal-body rod protein FlgG [Fluviicoccus keumensis]
MIDALTIAGSGLEANQAWIDSISNNIANMQTPGFKKSRVAFQDLVQQTVNAQEMQQGNTAHAPAGAGVVMARSGISLEGGAISQTGSPLDVAIQGGGFLEVLLPGGELAYTRAGRLHRDQDGRMVTIDGLELSGDISIPPDAEDVRISPDGHVRARIAGAVESTDLGQIRLARFDNPEGLQRSGNGLLMKSGDSGEPVYALPGSNGTGTLLQGHLELSNVNLVEEMTSLVMAQRAYQLNARLLQASDQILETLNNLRR